jgi:cytochrome c-type biogenesis protein CcmH
MNAPIDWLSASAILASGLILGTLCIYALLRRKGATVNGAGKRADLEAKRDVLLEQLRDIDASGLSDTGERSRLERETANVLRELDRCDEAPAPVVMSAPATKANPAIKGFLWGVASAVVVALLGFYGYVSATAKPSSQPMPGQPQQAATSPTQQGMPPAVQQLEEAVRNDPDNVGHRIALAKVYFENDNLMGTFEQTKAALAKDPNEPRALTYNAIVRMAMGQSVEAEKMLETASKLDPKLLDAWVALASARTQLGNEKGASAAIEAAVAQHPEEEKRLRDVYTQIKAQQASVAASGATPAAPPHPPMNADLPEGHPPMHVEPDTSAAPSIHITLAVGEGAKSKSGIVYVIARTEGASGGHPVAVKRVNATTFPMTVEIGAADSMMGQPFPATVRVEARLDSDGDAGTNDPRDPKAIVEGVAPGARLMLKLE